MKSKKGTTKIFLVYIFFSALNMQVFADDPGDIIKNNNNKNVGDYESYWTRERMGSAKPAPMPAVPEDDIPTPGQDIGTQRNGGSTPGQIGGDGSMTDQ